MNKKETTIYLLSWKQEGFISNSHPNIAFFNESEAKTYRANHQECCYDDDDRVEWKAYDITEIKLYCGETL